MNSEKRINKNIRLREKFMKYKINKSKEYSFEDI